MPAHNDLEVRRFTTLVRSSCPPGLEFFLVVVRRTGTLAGVSAASNARDSIDQIELLKRMIVDLEADLRERAARRSTGHGGDQGEDQGGSRDGGGRREPGPPGG